MVQVTRDVRDFGVELVPGEGLTYHTRENLDTYFWYAWDTSHASDAKKPCFSYPTTTVLQKSIQTRVKFICCQPHVAQFDSLYFWLQIYIE